MAGVWSLQNDYVDSNGDPTSPLDGVDDPKEIHVSGFNIFTIAKGPWYIGKACRLWQNIISTLCPKLWAKMTIQAPCNQINSQHLNGELVRML